MSAQLKHSDIIDVNVSRRGFVPAGAFILLLWCMATLASTAGAQLFSDDFTRGTDPGPLSPWTAYSGVWSVTGGIMKAGTNTPYGYALAGVTNSWTNYVVEGRIRFPSGAFGGGLGGRLNPATGAQYAAWVYPEGSLGGSTLVKLIKFQNWTN